MKPSDHRNRVASPPPFQHAGPSFSLLRPGLVALVALACTAFLGCGSQDKTESKTPTVRYSLPVSRPVIDYEVFTGRTEPFKNVDVRSQVTGRLDSILFEDGQDVAEGQRLFVIDPRPLKAGLYRADGEGQ